MFKYQPPMKKFTKAQCFAVIERMTEGEQPSNLELSALLQQFAPSAHAKPKTGFDWVKQAVAKKDVRSYLNTVYVNDGMAHGCDGRHLLIAPTDRDNGYYCPRTGQPVDESLKYPDIDRVKPKDTQPIDTPEPEYFFHGKEERVRINGQIYQSIYFKRMLNMPSTEVNWFQSITGLVCESDQGHYALILPLRQ